MPAPVKEPEKLPDKAPDPTPSKPLPPVELGDAEEETTTRTVTKTSRKGGIITVFNASGNTANVSIGNSGTGAVPTAPVAPKVGLDAPRPELAQAPAQSNGAYQRVRRPNATAYQVVQRPGLFARIADVALARRDHLVPVAPVPPVMILQTQYVAPAPLPVLQPAPQAAPVLAAPVAPRKCFGLFGR
jgi:hypothetical protein